MNVEAWDVDAQGHEREMDEIEAAYGERDVEFLAAEVMGLGY